MLPKPPNQIAIDVITGTYKIGKALIFAKSLRGPKNRESGSPRQALLIHPEGLGGNHTLVERQARWLIARDLFDLVILPDRRGAGGSSPITHKMTLREQAEDMQHLLDRMGIQEPVAVIGFSYGGPVGLTLASIDPRIQCAVMVAAAPDTDPRGRVERWLWQRGIIPRIVRYQIRRALGKRAKQQTDFDPGYDSRDPRVMSNLFADALKYTVPELADSLQYEYEATHDPLTAALPPDFSLTIPVAQIIGEGDERWSTSLPPGWQDRVPNFTRRVLQGAWMHHDLYVKAEAYADLLAEVLAEICPICKS